jgi:hypothetical protein
VTWCRIQTPWHHSRRRAISLSLTFAAFVYARSCPWSQIMVECWDEEPNRRPGFNEIVIRIRYEGFGYNSKRKR